MPRPEKLAKKPSHLATDETPIEHRIRKSASVFVPYSIRAISSRPPPPSDAFRQPKCAYFSRNWGLSANSDWLAEGVRPPQLCAGLPTPPQRPIEGSLLRPMGGVASAVGRNVHNFKFLPVLRTRTIRPTVFAGGTPDLTKTRGAVTSLRPFREGRGSGHQSSVVG